MQLGDLRDDVASKPPIAPKMPFTSNWSTILRLGEGVLIRIQIHQVPGSKIRPALVLLDTGGLCSSAHHLAGHAIEIRFCDERLADC
jgi:hypothetical protein